MNSKSYVNSFSEIRLNSKEEQEEILEKARYEAFTTLNLAGKATLYLVICVLVAFIAGSLPLFFLDFSPVVNAVSTGVGVAIAIVIYRAMYGRLLHQGVIYVLANRSRITRP